MTKRETPCVRIVRLLRAETHGIVKAQLAERTGVARTALDRLLVEMESVGLVRTIVDGRRTYVKPGRALIEGQEVLAHGE